MTLPTYNVLDGDGSSNAPRVPVVADFGGNQYVNDAAFSPKPPEQIPAEGVNQLINSAVGACATAPKATFTVSRSGSTLTLLGFRSCNTRLTSDDIGLVLADPLSTGENGLVIRWAKGQIPQAANAPSANIISRTRSGLDANVASYVDSTYAGVVVKVNASDGSASTAFTVRVDCDGEGAFG